MVELQNPVKKLKIWSGIGS